MVCAQYHKYKVNGLHITVDLEYKLWQILILGAYQNGTNLNGKVAASLIYNRALTDDEISQNYNYYKTRFGLA